ncbi:hypothetical protein M9H77_22341 [Catharanthus roseus]|uniref:Uncharacterized protein n=1 Tax=Catharanthus roseus TaxID=4058 RepID=A0ACC0ASU3_CATRO|nr:hypothetical protein M9H77_22341 [Catharanthus roseus]
MAPLRDKVMEEVSKEAVDISALEVRRKKREDPMLNKEKQPISKDEAMLVDKFEGAREKRKIVPRIHVQANVPGPSSVAPIDEEGPPKRKEYRDYSRNGDGG